jgi:AraC family transcriptional regulator
MPIETAVFSGQGGEVEGADPEAHIMTVHARGHIRAYFECDGMSVCRELRPGIIDLIPARREVRVVDEGPWQLLMLRIPERLDRADPGRVVHPPRRQGAILGLDEPALANLAWRLHRVSQTGPPLLREYLSDELIRRLGWERMEPSSRYGSLTAGQLRSLLDTIEERVGFTLSIAELSREIRLSPTAVKVGFRQATGIPIHRYIVQRRTARARLMLLEGRLPASQIALELGFAHQTHMIRWMRRLFGLSPRELARLVKAT